MRPRPPEDRVSVAESADFSYIVDLGLIDYSEAYAAQLNLVEKRRSGSLERDVFIVNEHPSTFTLGRRGGREHLIVSEEFLQKNNIPLVHIERGGEITYHGRGQLVIYPIFRLRDAGISVAEYVNMLEDVMIQLAAGVGVTAERDSRNHGVWADGSKLGSIGIAIRHGVSFHGLALNVNVELEPFGWVNPCGLTEVKMTNLQTQAGREVTLSQVKKEVETVLARVFGCSYKSVFLEELLSGDRDG